MLDRIRDPVAFAVTAALCAACADERTEPRLAVALTVDWEGAYIAEDGLDAIEELREALGGPPITHFISAGYFTKQQAQARENITSVLRPGDEVAVHLHGWKSLATASGIRFASAPSFLTGTDELMAFDDGDSGFDNDLDAYSVVELRQLLATSRQLLTSAGLSPSKAFRAGGYLGTPKLLQAAHDEGFTIDSSATDSRPLAGEVWQARVAQLWPEAMRTHHVEVRGGTMRELPIAAVADYASAEDIGAVLVDAGQRVASASSDVVVVLAFHQETSQFARRVTDAVLAARARYPALEFVTVTTAAERARR